MKHSLGIQFTRILLLASALFGRETLACGDRPVFSTQLEDGVTYGLFISDADFDKMHQWQPGDGEPPVSVTEAVAKSKKWGLEYFAKYEGVEISGIALQWTRCSSVAEKWYYLIEVTPVFDGHAVRSATRSVAVFLDGSVVGLKEFK